MQITTGHFNIFPILEFVAKNPLLPHNGSLNQKAYSETIRQVVKGVPADKPGWYLWGKFNDTGWWEAIYLGKAGKQKTSCLYNRLYDELREEAVAFWAAVYGRETASKLQYKLYKGKYLSGVQRSMRKSNTHFVVWIACPDISEAEVHKEERALIHIYRPANNAQREKYPDQSELTNELVHAIDEEIGRIKINI